jgi:hypothetical protein
MQLLPQATGELTHNTETDVTVVFRHIVTMEEAEDNKEMEEGGRGRSVDPYAGSQIT